MKCSAGGSGVCGGADATAIYTVACAPPLPEYDASLWWTQVTWADRNTLALPPFGETTDLVRGDLGLLRSTASYVASALVCMGNDQTAVQFQDAASPTAGSGYFYLLRGQRHCNDSASYSTYSPRENPGNPTRRDAEIVVCPP